MLELSRVLSSRVRGPQQREAGRGGTGDLTLSDQGLRKESPFPTQINCVCLNEGNWKRGSQQKTSEGFSKARYGRSRRQSAFTSAGVIKHNDQAITENCPLLTPEAPPRGPLLRVITLCYYRGTHRTTLPVPRSRSKTVGGRKHYTD